MSCISPDLAHLPYAMKYYSALLHEIKFLTFLEETLKTKPGMKKYFIPRSSDIDGHQCISNFAEVEVFCDSSLVSWMVELLPLALIGWNLKEKHPHNPRMH